MKISLKYTVRDYIFIRFHSTMIKHIAFNTKDLSNKICCYFWFEIHDCFVKQLSDFYTSYNILIQNSCIRNYITQTQYYSKNNKKHSNFYKYYLDVISVYFYPMSFYLIIDFSFHVCLKLNVLASYLKLHKNCYRKSCLLILIIYFIRSNKIISWYQSYIDFAN